MVEGEPQASREHRCKMCRYWYGADPDALRRVLSAPSIAAGVRA